MTLRNPNAEQIGGLAAQDWHDLQRTFRPNDYSFEDGASPGSTPQSEEQQLKMNLALAPLLSLLSKDESSGHEQRQNDRLCYTGKFHVHHANDVPRPAYARNVSEAGLGFLCDAPFLSRNISIELNVNETPVRLRCEVIRCTELIPNVYDVGVRFLQATDRHTCAGQG